MHPSVVENVHRQSGTSIKHVLRVKVIANIKPHFKVSRCRRIGSGLKCRVSLEPIASPVIRTKVLLFLKKIKNKNSYKTLRKELTW